MISSRTGAALALLLSICAVALGVVAFMATIRDDGPTTGRLVQTRLTNSYDGGPVQFPVDDFFAARDSDSHIRAYYAYPPGYFGHTRGCKVVWDGAATIDGPKGKAGPGLYIDPCGGARFDRDGELVFGPADRGLDYFGTMAGVEGVIVDTRKLICGRDFVPPPTETPAPATATVLAVTASVEALTATPEIPTATREGTPAPLACERVSPNTKRP